jgi:hypothetical protein
MGSRAGLVIGEETILRHTGTRARSQSLYLIAPLGARTVVLYTENEVINVYRQRGISRHAEQILSSEEGLSTAWCQLPLAGGLFIHCLPRTDEDFALEVTIRFPKCGKHEEA